MLKPVLYNAEELSLGNVTSLKSKDCRVRQAFSFSKGTEKSKRFWLDSFEIYRVVKSMNRQVDSLRLLACDFAHSSPSVVLRYCVACHSALGIIFPDRNEQIIHRVAQPEQL